MIIEIFLVLTVVLLCILAATPFEDLNLSWRVIRAMYRLPCPDRIPIIGLAIFVARIPDSELMMNLEMYCRKYPRLLATYVCGIPFVLLQKPEDIEVVMGSVNHITKGIEYKTLKSWLREGLLISTGEKWHQRRKFLTPAFHFRILEANLQSLNKHSRYLVRNMLKHQGQPFFLKELVTLCTLDIICETAMGVSLDFQDNKAKDYVEAIKRVSHVVVDRLLKFWLRRDWLFNILGNGKQFWQDLAKLHGFTEKIIRERKLSYANEKCKDTEEQEEDVFLPKKRKVFLDSLIELDIKHPNLLTNIGIREEVDTFMFEGHDTTSAAVTFIIYLLGCYPEIQEKAYQEQFNIFGDSDRTADNKDLHEMHYLEMVIKESLRLYPSVPYISRKINQDIKLEGDMIIPAGVNVIIPPYSVHRNPEVYSDPDVFDPERFTFENAKGRHPYAYIPFSAGPRNCIGQKFAMMELKVVISTVIRKLRLKSVTKREDIKVIPLLIVRVEPPIQIIATQRSVED